MKIALLVAAALAAIAATPSQALTFAYNYKTTSGANLDASGFITTSNFVNGSGGYSITGITGNVLGDLITSLTPNPSAPNAQVSASGRFIYDNNLFVTAPYLSNPGVLFNSSSFEYNLFSDTATQYELIQANTGGYTQFSVGTFVVSQVPEPATWSLLVIGFGLVGLSVRRRSTVIAV
nr:PEPxxWA-CTERM sorting domain-containing protein [Polymorphobacter sp.]